MADKRKDQRGRVLRTGESQRNDGRYCYRYTDAKGNRQSVYSWRLLASDKFRDDKPEKSLRELEKDILSELEHGVNTADSRRFTLDDAFNQFIDIRKDLKINSRVCYIGLYNKHVKDVLGYKSISSIRKSDISKLYTELLIGGSLKGSSLEKLNSVLYQVFDICVEDKMLLDNPASNALKKLRKTVDMSSEKRHALTERQQEQFIEFVLGSKTYSRYADIFVVLLLTGLRIGELLGLRVCDCDFKNDRIFVDHTLSYKPDESGKYSYRIGKTKTKAGTRIVPMLPDVKDILQRSAKIVSNFTIDGYSGFIFVNGSGKPFTPTFIYDRIQAAVDEYNVEESFRATRENRDPELIPKISAHNLRHTFCTRLCENTTDVKAIQEIMGHRSSRTTMDTYNESTEDRKKACLESLEGIIKLA